MIECKLKRLVAVSCLLVLLAVSSQACGGGTTEPTATPSPPPSIVIISPTEGDTLDGNAIEVRVAIANFVVDPEAVGLAQVPGRGHWHLYLDGEFVRFGTEELLLLTNVPTGRHQVRVSLANNDHSPLSPPVEQKLIFDVR